MKFLPTSGGASLPFVFDELHGTAVSLWERSLPGPVIRVHRQALVDVAHGQS